MTTSSAPSSELVRPAKSIFRRILKWLGILLVAILGAILFVGLFPVSSSGLDTQPDPAASYEQAMARYQQLEQAEQGIVNDASGSVLLTHDEKTPQVYVLIHGTTNSPHQWLEFGRILFDRGHNVLILRMPYHGLLSHQVSELAPLTAQDIRQYADQTMDVASGLGDEVDVIGLSGGGAVAAWMAQNQPEVDKTLLLAPFFGIGPVPTSLTPILINAFYRLPDIALTSPGEVFRDWAYMGESTRGVAAFLLLGQKVNQQAKEGKVPNTPIFVLTSASDHTASNQATADLVDIWKTAGVDVASYEFPKSLDIPHNSIGPLEDPEKRQIVYEKMLEFFGEQNP
jgi:pimeloyl-ACP methyl ester carboxylesterase